LNLIDTPGHVDFSYEVSRSLAACEGALLIVDASQGVQAQTLANINLAIKNNLKIIPIINKIDLTTANPDRVAKELQNISEIKGEEIILASAKEGIGTSDILEAIVNKIPTPKGSSKLPLRALIFDSIYNPYKGTIVYVKVVDGIIKPGMFIQTMSNDIKYEVTEIGIFHPKMKPIKELNAGEVGYIIAGFKNIKDTHVGDTIIDASNPPRESLPGYKKVTPLVFCSIYPVDNKDELSGNLIFDIMLDGQMSSIENEKYDNFMLWVQYLQEKLTTTPNSLRKPLKIHNCTIKFFTSLS